jgi:hypothetical protein
MENVETVWIDRIPSRHGKRRGRLCIKLWQSPDGWRWTICDGPQRGSEPLPTREAAIEAARQRDGLGPV